MSKYTLVADPSLMYDPRQEKLQERTQDAKMRYVAAFDAERPQRETEPEWLQARRASAITLFEKNGFPTVRDEDWKYIDVTDAANAICDAHFDRLSQVPQGDLEGDYAQYYLGGENALRIVFLNGHLEPKLSTLDNLPAGLVLTGIRDAIADQLPPLQTHLCRYASADDNSFVALNDALFNDGAFVHLRKGIELTEPVHLLFINTVPYSISQVRNLVYIEEAARLNIVESYVALTDEVYFTNVVTEIVAEKHAALDHYKEQRESRAAYHIATTQIEAADNAQVLSHTFTFGGAISRHDANAVLNGQHIEMTLNGLYLASGKQRMSNHTIMDHAMPNCHSFEEYAGILDDSASGDFNGKIYVRPDAQKTDAMQANRALLLSPKAEVNTKPQLEIFADDVKCTHGATIGELDEEGLFYLRSRGISAEDARDILVHAFAQVVLDEVKIDALREHLEDQLLQRLRH